VEICREFTKNDVIPLVGRKVKIMIGVEKLDEYEKELYRQ